MLGYVRPVKAELKVKEWEAYQGIYCGLCKQLGREYGFLARMTLNYDFVFLALLSMGLAADSDKETVVFAKQNCMIHPLRRRTCCLENQSLSYSCTVAILLMYHKLLDNLADGGFWERAFTHLLLLFAKGSYKKACIKQPQVSKQIEKEMAEQVKLEHTASTCVDEACEPTAACMAAIFSPLSQNIDKKRVLERMGYLMGRWVYLVDALDDFEQDKKNANFNPFLTAPTQDESGSARQHAVESLYLTIAEILKAYSLLNMRGFDSILENILYLGLKQSVDKVKDKNQDQDKT